MAAYELLSAEKRGNESFSKVIKRRLKPEKTARNLLDALNRIRVGDDALERMEEVVRSRSDSPAVSPVTDEE